MPIYNTNKFWNYITNEPLGIINKCKEILTRKDYNFDTKHYDISNYYNDISSFTVEYFRYDTIRFPAGLTKYLAEKVGLQIENCYTEKENFYTQEDVLKTAESIKQINPKFEIRDYQIEATLKSINNFRSLIVSSTGSGKGQPIDLIIPTPNGYKKLKELKIGDIVFDEKGKPTKIIGIFPQGIKKVYKFTFSSGKETYCDEEHLWTLSKCRNKKYRVFSTKELLSKPLYRLDNRGVKHYKYNTIQSVPVEYTPKKYDIDPYLLGVIIGDGSTTNNYVSISNPDIDSDIRDKINKILENSNYRTELDYHASCPRIAIVQKNKRIKDGFINKIKKLKLNCKSIYKFIPEEYLIGSIEQRLELLRGLMDTDGSCRKRKNNCSVSFSSSSLQLIKNVQELIFSLGGIARIQTIDKRGKNIGYTLLIQMNICPFYTSRKAKNWNSFIRNDYLKSIEYIKDTETVCIKVDSPNELYITSNYIITHNTSVMSLVTQVLSKDKILIINNNNFILKQIYDRILSFGETDICYNKGEEPDYLKRIVIMSSGLSDSRLNTQNKDYITFLNKVNTLIYDECQHMQSLTFFEPIFYTNPDNLRHIIGYTASPFREYKNPYKNPDDFRLIALIGEPVFKYEMKDTISDGNIAQPYAYFIRYQNKIPFIPEQFKDNYYMKYRASITYNKTRNKAGFEMIKYLYKHNIITFIAFNNIKPGQKLLEELYKENIKAVMIAGNETIYKCTKTKRGKIKIEEETGTPDTLKEEILNNNLKLVIGTSVLDEGVDIDLFQATVLYSAGKSPIGGLQKVGRSVRKKVNGMNVSLAIDFKDEGGLPMFRDHYLQRRELMEDSGIIILNDVHDFLDLVEKIEKSKEE